MGTKRHFNARGELTKISVHKGSGVTELIITYDESNRIATITDGIGRVFEFCYGNGSISVYYAGELLLSLNIIVMQN